MQGFLNLNKPAGWTSHDCVAKVRRLLKLKRVGHAGTLDPAATGVLPLALGRATRLLQFLPSNKAYHATIRFGIITTTDDLEGEIVSSNPVGELNIEQIQALLPRFRGKIEQVPPRYSAIHVQGKRLYDLARQGEIVEVPKRTVEVFNLETLDWCPGEYPELKVAIACGSGTYIRSIARDIGEMLSTGATLATLIRTQSSGFCLEESLTLEALETQIQQDSFQPVSPSVALQHLAAITLSASESQRWCQGQRIPVNVQASNPSPLRVYHPEGEFLGIGQLLNSGQDLILAPQVVLAA